MSRGESNTRCRARVSSTAPRFDPRWPWPAVSTESTISVPELAGQLLELGRGQRPQVGGAGDRVEQHGQRRFRTDVGQATASAAPGSPRYPAAGSRRPRRRVGRRRSGVTRLAAMPGLSSDLDRVDRRRRLPGHGLCAVVVAALRARPRRRRRRPAGGRRERGAADRPWRRSRRLGPRPAVPRGGAPDRARRSRARAGRLLPVGRRRGRG